MAKKSYTRELDGANLKDRDLRHEDFERASLFHVNFTGADLRGVSFYGAECRGAIFENADVAGANFTLAKNLNLTGAKHPDEIIRDRFVTGGLACVSEKEVEEHLRRFGWEFEKRGWPDRFCTRVNADGSVERMAVEIKTEHDVLSPWQEKSHRWLAAFGIPVYVVQVNEAPTTVPSLKGVKITGL